MNNKSRTFAIISTIIIALTVFIAVITQNIQTVNVYWILVVEVITGTVGSFSLNSESKLMTASMPLMIIYGLLGTIYAVVLPLFNTQTHTMLHIGEVSLLAITAIGYVIINSVYKKNVNNY